nr:uncharacterized protein LOC109162703 [Ipomoea batatas]
MENAHSGNSAGNSRRSLEDEDLLERSVKKSKRDVVDGLDETMVQNPDDPLDIGGPTSPCDNQMIPTDRENIGDEVMLTKSREIIEDEVIMTAANHNLESSNPSANRGTLSYKEKLAANVGFGSFSGLDDPSKYESDDDEKESAGVEHRNSGRDDGNRTIVTNQADITQTVSRPEVTEGYGPWMLAKKKERQRGNSSRYQKNDSRDILRAGLQVRHDGGNTNENQAQSNELGQKSRFSVLSGLEDHEEELEQITEKNSQNDSFVCVSGGSNLRITNESKDKGKKPMEMARPLPRSQMKINTQTHEEGKTKGNDKISETRGNMNESQRAGSSGSILRNRSRQAAAEHEHTVVRGTKGGEEIMRYTVFDDNRSTDMNPRTMNDCTFVEHTNDPPSHFCTTDAMDEEVFVDLDDESGFGQEGLPLPS